MEIENELRALRYLINNLILYVYDLRTKLEEISPSKRGYQYAEPNINSNSIAFDLFTIPKEKYNSLVEQFGVDVVTRACSMLDEFIKINHYLPYKTPYNSLRIKFIRDVLKLDNDKYRKADKPSHLVGLDKEEEIVYNDTEVDDELRSD